MTAALLFVVGLLLGVLGRELFDDATFWLAAWLNRRDGL